MKNHNTNNKQEQEIQICSKTFWSKIIALPEFKTLCIAMICMSLFCSWYVVLLNSNPVKAGAMKEIIVKHVIGGAAIGAMTGAPSLSKLVTNPTEIPEDFTKRPGIIPINTGDFVGGPTSTEFSNFENILLNSLISVTLICLIYGLFCLATHKFMRSRLQNKLILDTLSEMENSAQSQKSKWQKLGIPGIFIFVWIPLTGTGPIIGAILGRIIGLTYWTNLITVTAGSISSIIAWSYFAQTINKWFGSGIIDIVSNVFIIAVIAGIIVSKINSWLKKKKQQKQ